MCIRDRTCGGRGRVRVQQGFFAVERECSSCNGEGQIISDPCKSCRGTGVLNKTKKLSVNVPPGVDNGTRIRLSGEGEAGQRGSGSGDLYIFVQVRLHNIFTREGKDIYCQVPIDMASAALGGNFEVPTIDGGKLKINYDAGTQSGKRFRLRGKGMPGLRGTSRGDAYVETLVETPVNLTKRQKELLKEFSADGNSRGPQTDSFSEKLKRLGASVTGIDASKKSIEIFSVIPTPSAAAFSPFTQTKSIFFFKIIAVSLILSVYNLPFLILLIKLSIFFLASLIDDSLFSNLLVSSPIF